MESRLISGRAIDETTGVYATTMQMSAMMPANTQSSGRRRVTPSAAPVSAAGM
jgi:hypothetical protein